MAGETKERIAAELERLEQALLAMGHDAIAEKAAELAAKGRSDDVVFAFCGHFSAGKSSLINELCGAKLLPSSPIPTSANIVSIRSGPTEEAVLAYRDGRRTRVSIEDAPRYAKDGEAVESVELRAPIPLLGDRAVLLDTPGVDSTDDLHRQATEAALHLADLVFYVMDYNHVLSETNMEFAKRLSDSGKPLILIVNQIDKHREQELSFQAFRSGVDQSFRSWGVFPAAYFYTSLRAPEHPGNELRRLKAAVASLARTGSGIAEAGLARAAVELAEEGARAVRARNEARRSELARRAEGEDRQAAQRYEELSRIFAERAGVRERVAERLKAEAGAIGDNANVTPSTTRDLALKYLESIQPGFRVGLLFAAKKTEEERKSRLQAFQADFSEHVEARLVFHVQEAVRKAAFDLGLDDAAAAFAQEAVVVDTSAERLASLVRPGAAATGEYTLNYAKDIAADVRQQARRAALAAAERLADAAEALYARDEHELRAEAAALEETLAHRRELAALEQEEAAAREKLLAAIPAAQTAAAAGALAPVRAALEASAEEPAAQAAGGVRGERPAAGERQAASEKKPSLDLSRIAGGTAETGNAPEHSFGVARFAEGAALLEEASRLCETQPALANSAETLLGMARRMRERRFTAALFGAFSAGKSSFANSLLGEDALPVSPNPTTAAINTIVPPTPERPHGTALIVMKSREAVLADLAHALTAVGAEPAPNASAEELLGAARKIAASGGVHPGGAAHLAFLRAASSGFPDAEPLLGTEFTVGMEQFRAYAAEETKSAFVERIMLHYDSQLARAGVSLVDTPGADSINARHTGVAFNYMKNADAVFFVTYYNHAFSRADRQFLEQIGRVKDAFELDKMFFIVNAADLAEDEAELEAVISHVRDNLATFGIRHPRLFPVSSLEALAARRAGDDRRLAASGIAAFEASFRSFAAGELSALAYRAAGAELNRAVRLAEKALQHARSGASEREDALRQLRAAEDAARAELAAIDYAALLKQARRELEEQLYYVKQRFTHRFGEWFAASFNPSSLREDRGSIKESLAFAWRDLVSYLRTELVNEALSVSLRMERYLSGLLAEAAVRAGERASRVFGAYEPPAWEDPSFRTPEVDEVWEGEAPDMKLLGAHYRSSKQFFEGGGRTALRDELLRRWSGPASAAVDRLQDQFAAWLADELDRVREELGTRFAGALEASAAAARAALSRPADPAEAERVLRALDELRESFEAVSNFKIPAEKQRETTRL